MLFFLYQLEISNFLLLNLNINNLKFWFYASINCISNTDWLSIRFFAKNNYALTFFLFNTSIFSFRYISAHLHNKLIALHSSHWKYFYTSEILLEEIYYLENALEDIYITFIGFYYLNSLILLETFSYFKNYSILNYFSIYTLMNIKIKRLICYRFNKIITLFYYSLYLNSIKLLYFIYSFTNIGWNNVYY